MLSYRCELLHHQILVARFLRLDHDTFVRHAANAFLQCLNRVGILLLVRLQFFLNLRIELLEAAVQLIKLVDAGTLVLHRLVKVIDRSCLIGQLLLLQIIQTDDFIQHLFLLLKALEHDC